MFWTRPSAAELVGTGLKPKHYREPHVDVLPEAWEAVDLFRRFCTQWRIGAGGPVGLDYPVFTQELERVGVGGDDYEEMMAMLGIIERAALEEIHKS